LPRPARSAVSVVFFAHGALFGSWAARIPAVQDDVGLSKAALGLALAAATVGGLIAMPVAGWFVSRFGSRALVARGLPVFALLLPTLALAPDFALLALGLFAFGAAASAVDVAMNAHGLAVEGRYGRPILSSFHAAWSFGGLAGAAVGALAAWAGIAPLPHFALVAAVVGAGGLAVARLLLPAAADRPDAPPQLQRPPRKLLALSVVAFCGLFAEGASTDWSAVYLSDGLGAGAGLAALGFAAFSISMASFRLLGDRLTSRWGPRTLTRRGGVLAACALGAALLIGHPAAAIVAFLCMGAGLATIVPITFRAAGSLPDVPAGVGIAALTTVGYSAFLAGPVVIGLVAEAVGLPLALGVVVAMLALMAALSSATSVSRAAPAVAPGS
jgi:MFS family permease